MSEAEVKLAKCRHSESWPTFLCHMYCVVPSFSAWWAVSAPRRAKGMFIIYQG